MGNNTNQTHPKFGRRYKDGNIGYGLHAEMNVMRFARPGDSILVMRFSKRGELTMSLPCQHCQRFMKKYGIKQVTYSDWNGEFKKMKIRG